MQPLTVLAGHLSWRGRQAGPLLGLGPAAFTACMFVQYVVGPEHKSYSLTVGFHLVLFVLSLVLLAVLWQRAVSDVGPDDVRSRRRWAVALGLFTLFIVTRYLESFGAMAIGGAIPEAYMGDVTMYWTVVFLHLGVVVPASVATVVGLLRASPAAGKALVTMVGWYALVAPAVAATGVVKLVVGDPVVTVPQVLVLAVAAIVFVAAAERLYRPLLIRESRPSRARSASGDARSDPQPHAHRDRSQHDPDGEQPLQCIDDESCAAEGDSEHDEQHDPDHETSLAKGRQ